METKDIVFTVFTFLSSRQILKILFTTKTFREAGRIVLSNRMKRWKIDRILRYHKFPRTEMGEFSVCEFDSKYFHHEHFPILCTPEDYDQECEKDLDEDEFLEFQCERDEEETKMNEIIENCENYGQKGVIRFSIFHVHPIFHELDNLPEKIHQLGVIGMFHPEFLEDLETIENDHLFNVEKNKLGYMYEGKANKEKDQRRGRGGIEEGSVIFTSRMEPFNVSHDSNSKDVFSRCSSPPYGMRGDVKEEVKFLRKELFQDYEDVEIKDWCQNCEEGNDERIWMRELNAGLEWWGCYCYSYWIKSKGLLVISFANETD